MAKELPRTTYWVMYNHSIPPFRPGDEWMSGDWQHCGTEDLEAAKQAVRDITEKYVKKQTHFSTWAGIPGRINRVWIEVEVRSIYEG